MGSEPPPIYQSVKYHRASGPAVDGAAWLFCSRGVTYPRGKLAG